MIILVLPKPRRHNCFRVSTWTRRKSFDNIHSHFLTLIHLQQECFGNKVQACMLRRFPDQEMQFAYVSCQMNFENLPVKIEVTLFINLSMFFACLGKHLQRSSYLCWKFWRVLQRNSSVCRESRSNSTTALLWEYYKSCNCRHRLGSKCRF